MCIAEPGVVLSVTDGMARVSLRGVVRDVPLTVVAALGIVVSPGDIVLVHTGLAVAVLTGEEAAERVSFFSREPHHDS